jgi:putative glutamine amidotransferase
MALPRIVVTLSDPARAADPAAGAAKNARYLAALTAAGAEAIPLTAATPVAERATAFDAMAGLLISGGADLDPVRYGEQPDARTVVDEGRDGLDEAAWRAADRARLPVLGICRGLQALNIFAGGSLVQHVEGHVDEAQVVTHPISIAADSRFGRLAASPTLIVNSYHHQALRPDQVGRGLRVAATAPHPGGIELVEALESTDPDRWLMGVQCHPERTESSPPVLAALWTDFVAACARHAAGR